jgi:hypothetical protein
MRAVVPEEAPDMGAKEDLVHEGGDGAGGSELLVGETGNTTAVEPDEGGEGGGVGMTAPEAIAPAPDKMPVTPEPAPEVDPATVEVQYLNEDEARQLTEEIRTVGDQHWELIKRAYQGRAWLALGYETWDDYVEAQFSSNHYRVPREEQQSVVLSLRQAGMSLRAIADVAGVGKDTVRREIERAAGANETPAPPAKVRGKDGRSHPARQAKVGKDQAGGGKTAPSAAKAKVSTPKPGPAEEVQVVDQRHPTPTSGVRHALGVLAATKDFDPDEFLANDKTAPSDLLGEIRSARRVLDRLETAVNGRSTGKRERQTVKGEDSPEAKVA